MRDKNATEMLVADDAGIARAAEILLEGGLVALPTETVYGLAARADHPEAVARIYHAKGRPGFNPLIVHVASLEQARSLAEFGTEAKNLAQAHWPGALTLVLPRKPDAGVAPAITAGLPTIALRMPSHPIMRRVLDECGIPLAAPSANRSNTVSPTTASHVLATLDGRIDAVVDAGPCEKGLESSIVAVRQDGSLEELRSGPLVIGGLRTTRRGGNSSKPEAPGQLERHYSPGKPMRLEATEPHADEFMIGFGDVVGDVSLSVSGNLQEPLPVSIRHCIWRLCPARPGSPWRRSRTRGSAARSTIGWSAPPPD